MPGDPVQPITAVGCGTFQQTRSSLGSIYTISYHRDLRTQRYMLNIDTYQNIIRGNRQPCEPVLTRT